MNDHQWALTQPGMYEDEDGNLVDGVGKAQYELGRFLESLEKEDE